MTPKNNHGQALIESLCILALTTPLFVLLVFTLLQAITTVALDHFLDAHLICLVEGKTTCLNETEQKLRDIGWKNISLTQSYSSTQYTVTLKGKTSFGYDVTKQRELQLDLEVH